MAEALTHSQLWASRWWLLGFQVLFRALLTPEPPHLPRDAWLGSSVGSSLSDLPPSPLPLSAALAPLMRSALLAVLWYSQRTRRWEPCWKCASSAEKGHGTLKRGKGQKDQSGFGTEERKRGYKIWMKCLEKKTRRRRELALFSSYSSEGRNDKNRDECPLNSGLLKH